MDGKALASAIAVLLVLVASGSASALTITSLSSFDFTSEELTSRDLNRSGWSFDATDSSRYTSSVSGGSWHRFRDGDVTTAPVPEPSAALVFGLGLFAASRFARYKH